MSLVWRGLAWVLAISLVVYFVIQASKALDLAVLREALSQSDVWLALLVGSLLYACIIPVTGWAWAILLSAFSASRN
jgi:Na+-transporting NADH:ubiquinone oxidoreductase subunit NqrB